MSKRIVLLGSGVLGSRIATNVRRRYQTLVTMRIKLCQPELLAKRLDPNDTLIIAAAKLPCRDSDAMIHNMWMTTTICEALARKPVAHVVNISSDAVYGPIEGAITERSPTWPESLLGAMHLSREAALLSVASSLLIVRLVALFGPRYTGDTYGPNSFLRDARRGVPITLYGDGSELRDHMYVWDAAQLIAEATLARHCGVLNLATGSLYTFSSIARAVAEAARAKIVFRESRPHEMKREFDTSRLQPFISMRFTSPLEVEKWASA